MNNISVTTLGDLVLAAGDQWRDKQALIVPSRALSFGELKDNVTRRSRALISIGIKPGDHVGILMPNSIEMIEWMFAVAFIGGVAVMINARYKSSELRYVIKNADIKTLITSNNSNDYTDFVSLIKETLPDIKQQNSPFALSSAHAPGLDSIIVEGDLPRTAAPGFIDQRQLDALAENTPLEELWSIGQAVSLQDYCLMLYTSGTTASPKGCRLTHEAVVRLSTEIGNRLRITANERQWNPLPLFHLASVMPMLATLIKGGSYIFSTHFEAEAAWDLIEKERATFLYPAFPTVMSELLTHPRFKHADLSHIRLINNVAPPERLLENMKKIPGAIHISAYGMTEATGLCCYSDLDDDNETRAATIGPPLPGVRLTIVDPDTGTTLPANQKGEICVKGFSVFDGYYRDPEKTIASMDDQGWFHTGDLGAVDAQGRLSFYGRLKEILKVGGENVSALELESYLLRHPAVKLVQVVGVPDKRLDEVPAAFIELNDGSECCEQNIIDYCKGNIASFKVPRYVRFVTAWPMSATKIKKHALREQLCKELNIAQ